MYTAHLCKFKRIRGAVAFTLGTQSSVIQIILIEQITIYSVFFLKKMGQQPSDYESPPLTTRPGLFTVSL